MIQFSFNDTEVNIQAVPIYGAALGVLYYDPNLEPDRKEDVPQEEFFQQLTLCFLLFGIHITVWKEYY